MQLIVLLALLAAPPAGLQGLGAPGGLAKSADPKVTAFENDLLAALNAARAKAKADPITMDERLRAFARREAELAARGSPEAKSVGDRIKQQGLAPNGHRLQFGFGTKAAVALADLVKDPEVKAAFLGDFQRAGLGAFFVPDDKPYFQVAALLIHDPDPMAGKPGLSPAQTDPVVNAAMPEIKRCYDGELKRNPNLRGDCILQVVIGASGAVDAAKMLKPLGSPGFDECALEVAKRMQFPAPYKGKPVTLNQPMRFSPPQGNKQVGRLTPSQVQSAFGMAQLDFKSCYDKRQKAVPTLAGTITLGLTVGPDGAIAALDVLHDEPADGELTRCVLERARQVRFPVPEFESPVALTYPLRFAPP